MADQALTARATPAAGDFSPRVPRCTGQASEQTDTALANVDYVLAGLGSPLQPALRLDMEQRFGHDFSSVRIHTGAPAKRSAREVNAHAYTVGHNIVFGAGSYAPQTVLGRKVLAHELAHVLQQRAGLVGGKGATRLQRLALSDVLEAGASLVLGGGGEQLVRQQRQLIDDFAASIAESPEHVGEFFEDEVWASIREHWVQVMAVTAGIIVAEMAIGVLTAIPEPTLLTKVIAAILQILVVAILGYFAVVEVVGAYEEGRRWLSTVRRANGDPRLISEASRSFVRMVWHIVLAILTVAGVRARGPRAAGPNRVLQVAAVPQEELYPQAKEVR